jgi:hypothetical protein
LVYVCYPEFMLDAAKLLKLDELIHASNI